jgi:hypothetical protein
MSRLHSVSFGALRFTYFSCTLCGVLTKSEHTSLPAIVTTMLKRAMRLLAVVLPAAVALSGIGCSPFSSNAKYLFEPDVNTQKIMPQPPICTSAGNECGIGVTKGTEYAHQVENEYRGAKSEYGSITASFGTLLIPVGASAMALGATGQSATAVTLLGFGAAAIFGEGYLLSNAAREKVYMTGSDALECLIGTMRPFDETLNDFKTLHQRVGDLENPKVSGVLSEQAIALEQELNTLRTDPCIANDRVVAKPILCYAEKTLKAAKSAQQAAIKADDAATKFQNLKNKLEARW